jgi:hypothetical protein
MPSAPRDSRQTLRQRKPPSHRFNALLTSGRSAPRACSQAHERRSCGRLTWSHTDLDGESPSVQLWRSLREGGDTKTRLSRRTLELPNECVVALRTHRRWQTRVACATRHSGRTMILSSRPDSAPLSTPPTCGVHSARWPSAPGSELRNGHRESCATASSRCCRAQASRSRTSLIWSGTRTPVQRKGVSQGIAPGAKTRREGDG